MAMDHRTKTELDIAARRVFGYMTADRFAGDWGMDIDEFDWNPGVGLISLAYYHEYNGSPAALDYLKEWMHKNMHKGGVVRAVNTTAAFGVYPLLYERTGDKKYLNEAVTHADWLMTQACRAENGAFQHSFNTVESYETLRGQIWADTIFMACLFLAKTARLTDNKEYAQEAVHQLELHLEALQSPENGLLYHGYSSILDNHMSGILWARGNAWIAVGLPAIAAEVDRLAELPAALIARYVKMIDGLIAVQGQHGMWHTVLTNPLSYAESSATAGIACGIVFSVLRGILPQSYLKYADAAANSLIPCIDAEGMVAGVSGGTPIMENEAEYKEIPRYPTLYGQGLTLMLLAMLETVFDKREA